MACCVVGAYIMAMVISMGGKVLTYYRRVRHNAHRWNPQSQAAASSS
jgi:hypothetical protein